MYDITRADDLLYDAAEWLLQLPEPTHAHLSAACTLLLEASRIRRGQDAMTRLASAAPATLPFEPVCIHCGTPAGANGDQHITRAGHTPEFRRDGTQYKWSAGRQAYEAIAHQLQPADPRYELHLSCGDTISAHAPAEIGAYRTCDHCGTRKRVAQVIDHQADAADVSRETSPAAVGNLEDRYCLYSRAGYGACLEDIGHKGDHRDGHGHVFSDLPDDQPASA